MMSARRSERFGWPTRSAAVKSFNHRNDSYRNGNSEGHRVDPRGLRGHRGCDGLFAFISSDFPWRPPGRFPDPGNRDWSTASILRRLSSGQTRRVPDCRLICRHPRPRGRFSRPAGRDGPARIVRGIHGRGGVREAAHPDVRKSRGPPMGIGSRAATGMADLGRRDEANIDEMYKLGAQEALRKMGLLPTFVVTGNMPVVLRESLLPKAFEMGERAVERSIALFGGMIGPFCLETIVSDQLEFKVFEISTRIVAGTNLFVGGSPYADLQEPGMSTGRRIAREIRIAQKQGLLADILS